MDDQLAGRAFDRSRRRLTTAERIAPIVRSIVETVDPEQVVLFGSRARGDFGEESDVDLVVIEAEPFGPARSRHREMLRLLAVVAKLDVAVTAKTGLNSTAGSAGASPVARQAGVPGLGATSRTGVRRVVGAPGSHIVRIAAIVTMES